MEQIVTKIEELSGRRRLVYINGEQAFALYSTEVRRYGIAEGKALAQEDLEQLRTELLDKRAVKRAMYLLQAKDYTEKELTEKLQRDFYPQESVEGALAYVRHFGYLSDERFAQMYVQLKGQGKSRKQIKSDRTSDETSADDVNKKVSDPSAETEEVKAPADIQVKVSEEHKMYRKALTRAWKRLGYSNELAELRTQIICTGEESELEWLAAQVRNRQFRREEKACAYKQVGDVRMKQGQTREAFANYKKALEYEMPSYVRTELYRIFINDLNDGSRQAKSFGKKTDITVVLDKWLDKYESIEDIKKIVQTVTVK